MQIPGGGVEPPEPAVRARIPRALLPFTSPQYRVLALALILSMLGAGMWVIALFWQVVGPMGGSALDYSLILAIGSVGMLCFALLGGAVADRVPQQRILLAVELVKGVGAGIVAVLAFAGGLELWHLIVVGLLISIADAFFYPAYTALLPSLLPEQQLLAANGVEGVLRPAIMMAFGPALAAMLVDWYSPAVAFAVLAGAQLLAALILALFLRATPVRRDLAAGGERGAVLHALIDIRDGLRYLVRTPWLLWTLLFACFMVLMTMGPIEVLMPFVIKDQAGGGPNDHALVLAVFGIGGVVGSIVTASLRLPRRYLTVMVLFWGLGCLPMVGLGLVDRVWLIAIGAFIIGYFFQAATVIWGTLLQRRVPAEMLGRVSSLDFFVSLALMPVSMAIAAPVAAWIGLQWTFIVAGVLPAVFAVIALIAARMPADELAHPLDDAAPDAAAEPASRD